MARYMNPSPEAISAFSAEAEDLSGPAKAIARCLDPWSLYRYEGYPHRWMMVIIRLYAVEEPFIAFAISGRFNAVTGERIQPIDLATFDLTKVTPAELPAPGEPVGSLNEPFIIKGYEGVAENAKAIR